MNLINRSIPILLLICICSCTNTQKITYLQDLNPDNAKTNELIKTIRLQESQYKLKPADRLLLNIFSLTEEKINFLKKPELEVLIDNTGQIELPVIGMIAISGLTIKEAETKIKAVTADFLKNPSVTIKLLNFNYTVIGEVNKQGTFNAPEPKVNILEAIGQAGGLTDNANRENIRIIRNDKSNASIYQLNLLEDNSIQSQNYFLQPNDVIVVNPLKSNANRQQRTATIGLVVSVLTSVSLLLYQLLN